jgi:hypothetical protein
MSQWLSADNVKFVITTLATLAFPLALGYVSYEYQRASAERQGVEARLRLYTELLSKREEADTGVRKGIFDRVLETYLKPGGEDLQQRLVALELLALNFHDSLALSPLFWQLQRQILREPAARREDLLTQLERIARAIKDRQVEVLEVVGVKRDATIDFDELASKASVTLFDEKLSFDDPDPLASRPRLTRRFQAEVVEQDAKQHRLLVRVQDDRAQWALWVDVFDFPMVDFVRLSKSERFTVVLRTYKPRSAQLTFIYYPSSRGGVKDKPFIDEVISDLRREMR